MYSLDHKKLGLVAFACTLLFAFSIALFAFAATVDIPCGTPCGARERDTVDNSWATTRCATGDYAGTNGSMDTDNIFYNPTYGIVRGFMTFNTSSTTLANSTITAVTLTVNGTGATKVDNGGSVNLAESSASMGSGGIMPADFPRVLAACNNPTMIATAKTVASLNTASANVWTFNATGIAYVQANTATNTLIAMLGSQDYTGTAPGSENEYYTGTLTGSTLYLTVTYTPNAAGGVTPVANFIDFSLNWIKEKIQKLWS